VGAVRAVRAVGMAILVAVLMAVLDGFGTHGAEERGFAGAIGRAGSSGSPGSKTRDCGSENEGDVERRCRPVVVVSSGQLNQTGPVGAASW
jgi:hypothetical protein